MASLGRSIGFRRVLRLTAVGLAILTVISAGIPIATNAQQTPPEAQTQPATTAPPAPDTAPQPVSPVPQIAAPDEAEKPTVRSGGLRELSPLSMFMSADPLVKAVIVSLIFASLATWTILLAKTVQLSRARRRLSGSLANIANARSLSEARLTLGVSTGNILAAFLSAATQEIRMSADSIAETGIKERAASQFTEIMRTETRAARYGMGMIATIGATAPFVGLFGTVWGIMNSFIGISKAQTTNLAVVAPGIAEALLATAAGLAAAIPAVIIYNHFSRATRSYLDLVRRGSGAVGRLLSRDLDRLHSGAIVRAAE